MKKKSLEELHELLNTYVCRGDVHNLLNILSQSNLLDVANSKLFNIAVESQSTEIVEALLSYFENNQLIRYIEGSFEFLQLKKKMHDILEVSVEDVKIPEEMKIVLSPYINLNDKSDESDQDLSGLDIEFNPSDEEYMSSESSHTHLTEENLKLLNESNLDYPVNDLYSVPVIGQY